MKHFFFLFLLLPFGSFSQDCQDVPEHNQAIVQLAKRKIRRKVGRGECWDLAQYVLDETNSKWDGYEVYGRLINRKRECLYPGDIIQFERIKIKYKEGSMTYTENMRHHTAIVYEVKDKNEIYILHQNTGEHGRRVGKSRLRFDTVTSGKMMIYRPEK